ncbi:stage II sporulation protein P, partial [[Clostridium] symbiosum]|uniref:stage II sporulation protein P n=1 Tax=Clostridium symbiosum TaxID=1512 RepID=UPI002109B227
MKLCADACYPGFTRKIYLKGLRYNQHVRPCSALIEVGKGTVCTFLSASPGRRLIWFRIFI